MPESSACLPEKVSINISKINIDQLSYCRCEICRKRHASLHIISRQRCAACPVPTRRRRLIRTDYRKTRAPRSLRAKALRPLGHSALVCAASLQLPTEASLPSFACISSHFAVQHCESRLLCRGLTFNIFCSIAPFFTA